MGVLGFNRIAFRSPDAAALRTFHLELTGAEALEGEHDPSRVGHTLLALSAGPSAPLP